MYEGENIIDLQNDYGKEMSPEQKLMMAIIEQAIYDYKKNIKYKNKKIERKTYLNGYEINPKDINKKEITNVSGQKKLILLYNDQEIKKSDISYKVFCEGKSLSKKKINDLSLFQNASRYLLKKSNNKNKYIFSAELICLYLNLSIDYIRKKIKLL